jgi:predicted PurR-regulated permease PerM
MKDRFRTFNSGRANFFLVAIITCILAGAALKMTAPVILPLTVSLLLALVLNPTVKFMEKFHIPRFIGIFLTILFIITVVCVIGVVLFTSGRSILTLYPKYENRLTEIYIALADFFEFSYDEHLSFFENLWAQLGIRSRIRLITLSFSNEFIIFLKDAVMVVLFVVFLLFESVYFMIKLDVAFDDKRSSQIKKISSDVIRQVSRYLTAKFFISLATGLVVGVGLGCVGLEFAAVWGVIQFFLNFIPSIGSIASGVGASVFALIQFWPDPVPIVITAIIMLGANMIIGNVLEPQIIGDNLGLSPLVVLISLMLWGWLWGFVGMVLAVPMTVIGKIICENIAFLEPVSILLGSRKEIAIKKEEKAREETLDLDLDV